MSLKKRFILFACLLGLMVIAAIVLNQKVATTVEASEKTSAIRYLSYLLADEFRQTSQDLTRNCRTYVATGNSDYIDAYNLILDWRSGKTPRPNTVDDELFRGVQISQKEIMKKLGFSEKEFALLAEASANSDALVKTEVQAMNSIANNRFEKGPFEPKPGETPREFALRITFDQNYHSEVAKIMAPVTEFFDALDKRTAGEVAALQKKANFYGELALGLQMLIAFFVALMVGYLIRSVFNPLKNGIEIVSRIANGDYAVRWDRQVKDELGELAEAVNTMSAEIEGNLLKVEKQNHQMAELISNVTRMAQQVSESSEQVGASSQALSQGATEQASSLEEISSSINEMESQTSQNAENADIANSLAKEVSLDAARGNDQMRDMISAMEQISEAGKYISNIIKTIDEIAFKTNLLALNAAVEAARAGQHGKGFAVVAEEVRNLAARSAKAASETAELIEGSVAKTENGATIAAQTAEALGNIVTGVGKVTDLVAEIAAASNEQAQGIAQINQGLNQIGHVTQRNTANAEESAAAAEELAGQSSQLSEILSQFSANESELHAGASDKDQSRICWVQEQNSSKIPPIGIGAQQKQGLG